jgi:hypothetical protein
MGALEYETGLLALQIGNLISAYWSDGLEGYRCFYVRNQGLKGWGNLPKF